MNILICPDKFKGSLNARQVCDAVSRGVVFNFPKAIIDSVPLADGGEGTCALLTEWHEGYYIDIEVQGPLFSPVRARYGISRDRGTAFIEMAEASGLTLLKPEERNPLLTTSFGTGQMIADAFERGAKKIILGIGGSATNDAGIGMASALGYTFHDSTGTILKPTGENLIHIHDIDTRGLHAGIADTSIIALCDVTNPLYGPDGAAFIYGPQKGADPSAVELLDAGLRNFRRVVHKQLRNNVDFPGAGAAGGLGAGAKVFLNATIQKGVNYLIETTALEEKVKRADLIITGEGKIDQQTFSGKVISEILRLAKRDDKPVVAICGICDVSEQETLSHGIRKVISLVDDQTNPESAIRNAAKCVTNKVRQELKDFAAF